MNKNGFFLAVAGLALLASFFVLTRIQYVVARQQRQAIVDSIAQEKRDSIVLVQLDSIGMQFGGHSEIRQGD